VLLAGLYTFSRQPKSVAETSPNVYIWSVKSSDLQRVAISLPREGKSQAFLKVGEQDTFPWVFDDARKLAVDSNRWGGGIPLLLSGPAANRIITNNASSQDLTEYGLTHPSMEISLTVNKEIMKITVGDSTPNGQNYYILAPQSNTVAIVDYTWYDVLTKLVTDPPYAQNGKNYN
jgi:hypothetical protein